MKFKILNGDKKYNINQLVFIDMDADDDIIGFVVGQDEDSIEIRYHGSKETIHLLKKEIDVENVDEMPSERRLKILKRVYGH